MSIELYDCTIREGKPLNNLGYGAECISGLEAGMSDAGVESVDVGYLTEETFLSDFAFYDNIDRAETLLPTTEGSRWVISVRIGRNEMNLLPDRHGKISTVRFAVPFHGMDVLKTYASIIKSKGYEVICELDSTFGYKDRELLDMIEAANDASISQLTIADRTGRIDPADLQRFYYLLNNNLKPEIRIGARFGDAYKSAYQMAQSLMEYNRYEKRTIVLEGSLCGIGESEGDLCLEVAADYVNDFYDGNYLLDSFYSLIDKYIQPVMRSQLWGYHPAYYLAGKYKIDSDYSQFFLEKEMPIVKIHAALKELAKTQEYKEFDEKIAEKVFQEISAS